MPNCYNHFSLGQVLAAAAGHPGARARDTVCDARWPVQPAGGSPPRGADGGAAARHRPVRQHGARQGDA